MNPAATIVVAPGSTSDSPGDPGTLLFENDRVRVWELIMKPGEICNWHVHDYDHLLIVYDGCLVQARRGDGSGGEREIADGTVLFMPASAMPEIARNVSLDRTLRELIVDFKDPKMRATDMAQFGFLRPGTATTSFAGLLP